MNRIRYAVLLPPLVPLLICGVMALRDPADLVTRAQGWSNWILTHFDWLFSWSGSAFIVLLVVVYFSPLGNQRIGGREAQPLLSPWRWFAITVCTTIATGILFWGIAEPIYHLSGPPPAGEAEPAVFALSTMFLHWTITPYAIYTVGGLLFAIGFYTRQQPFTLSTLLEPVFGRGVHGWGGATVDAICLFALVAGMAASLGSGGLTLLGGTQGILGGAAGGVAGWSDPALLGLIILLIVIAFSISTASGLQRGIRLLSSVNLTGFVILALFVFLSGPTLEALSLAGRAGVDYLATFVPRNLGIDSGIPADWSHSWTAFYWANWYAWAPITGLFLGRLARGYTVRRFIEVNLVYTSLFGAFWMIVFGGTALVLDQRNGGTLTNDLLTNGPEAVAYTLLAELPWLKLTAPFFLLLVFLSYVTAADSNVNAMSALCTHGIAPDRPEAPLFLKLLWGSLIGLTAWTLVSFAGVDGIRLMSVLGGFPAMFLLILAGVGLGRLALVKN